MTKSFFEYTLSSLTENEVSGALKKDLDKAQFSLWATLNAEMLVLAQQHPILDRHLKNASQIFADGMGIVLAARRLYSYSLARITGLDLVHLLCGTCQYSIYCVGADEETIKKAMENLTKTYPYLEVKGFHHGYLSKEDEDRVIADILEKKPDIVFVGMGIPKQEAFLQSCSEKLTFGVGIGVGGIFDVLSGNVKRAPKWVQKCGFEWLYRVVKDLKRIRRLGFIPRFFSVIYHEKKR